jgi:hypothetical protein
VVVFCFVIHSCNLPLALLEVPKCSRAATHFTVIVVSRLNRAALSNVQLPGGFLGLGL